MAGLGAALPERKKGKKKDEEGSDGEEDPDFNLDPAEHGMLMKAMASNRGALLGALQVTCTADHPVHPQRRTSPRASARRRRSVGGERRRPARRALYICDTRMAVAYIDTS